MKILTKRHWKVFFGMICKFLFFFFHMQESINNILFFRYGYQLAGKGKWSSMALKKPKVKGIKSKGSKKKQKDKDAKWKEQNSGGEEEDEGEDEVCSFVIKHFPNCFLSLNSQVQLPNTADTSKAVTLDGSDPTDPLHTTPLPRYNAMLAVLRNTLYM